MDGQRPFSSKHISVDVAEDFRCYLTLIQSALLNGAVFLSPDTVTALQTGSSAIIVTAITASITWNMKQNVSKL